MLLWTSCVSRVLPSAFVHRFCVCQSGCLCLGGRAGSCDVNVSILQRHRHNSGRGGRRRSGTAKTGRMSTAALDEGAQASLPASFDPDEIFDVCNEQNEVIGQEKRGRVHADGLYHRSVQVILLNTRGEMLLQRRSPNKDVAPGSWDLSSSEHLQPSEEYGAAAARGLYEELGIDQATAAAGLTRVLPAFLQENEYPNVGKIDREFVECWLLKDYSGPVKVDNVEVVESVWTPSKHVMKFAASTDLMAPWFADTMGRLQKAVPELF